MAANRTASPNTHRKLTQAELCAEASERFGSDPHMWAFQCPRCGDIAVVGDFPKGEEGRLGQECVGRHRGALKGKPTRDGGKSIAERGCDWAAYGLFRGPWEIVMPDGRSAWGFPLAPAPALRCHLGHRYDVVEGHGVTDPKPIGQSLGSAAEAVEFMKATDSALDPQFYVSHINGTPCPEETAHLAAGYSEECEA